MRHQEGKGAIPAELAGTVEGFKTTFLAIERRILSGRNAEEDLRQQTRFACDSMTNELTALIQQRPDLEEFMGAFFFREAFPVLMRSRFMGRAFGKPMGYAGDYATIEYLYENVPHGEGLQGEYVDDWVLSRPAPQAVRNRRQMLANTIIDSARQWTGGGPMPVTSLGSGPARELFDVFASPASVEIHATCIDIDRSALSYARGRAQELGVESRMTFRRDSLIRICEGKGRAVLPHQQLIYSTGLIDYLDDRMVVSLIDWAFDRLLPGGTVALGNFDVSNGDRAFMDHILEWCLNYRSPGDLIRLFNESRFERDSVQVTKDASGVQLLALCRKP